jgi:hypothetical protein
MPRSCAALVLLLLLLLAVRGEDGRLLQVYRGEEAVRRLGLHNASLAGALRHGALGALATSSGLAGLLLRDSDLGVQDSGDLGMHLVYTCGCLLPSQATGGGGLSSRRILGERGAPGAHLGRQLQQLPSAHLEDPAPDTVRRTASGLPLLHRWAARASAHSACWALGRPACALPGCAAGAGSQPDAPHAADAAAAAAARCLPLQPPRRHPQGLPGFRGLHGVRHSLEPAVHQQVRQAAASSRADPCLHARMRGWRVQEGAPTSRWRPDPALNCTSASCLLSPP